MAIIERHTDTVAPSRPGRPARTDQWRSNRSLGGMLIREPLAYLAVLCGAAAVVLGAVGIPYVLGL